MQRHQRAGERVKVHLSERNEACELQHAGLKKARARARRAASTMVPHAHCVAPHAMRAHVKIFGDGSCVYADSHAQAHVHAPTNKRLNTMSPQQGTRRNPRQRPGTEQEECAPELPQGWPVRGTAGLPRRSAPGARWRCLAFTRSLNTPQDPSYRRRKTQIVLTRFEV